MSPVKLCAGALRCRLGEGPLWSPRENALYWVDILGHTVHRLRLDGESVSTWALPEKIGWLIERANQPGFIAGLQSGIALLNLEPLTIQMIARPERHLPENRMNDAKADAMGRVWAGTMHVAGDRPSGAHYRVDPDHSVTCVGADYLISNGPAFSPDHRVVYHTDSGRGLVYRFDLTADGRLANREVFLQFDPSGGTPDGMTVDASGALWIALWGGSRVSCYTAEGRFDRSIELPASQITSCTFAGQNLDRMFVTSAAEGVPHEPHGGALFEVSPGVKGFEIGRFGG